MAAAPPRPHQIDPLRTARDSVRAATHQPTHLRTRAHDPAAPPPPSLRRPIFVVQSESHYSVLWANGETPPDALADPSDRLAGDPEPEAGYEAAYDDEEPIAHLQPGGAFDLFYFDQMAERDDAVRLTLRHAADGGGYPSDGHGAPLELMINSRWPAAVVDWNGEEVIL